MIACERPFVLTSSISLLPGTKPASSALDIALYRGNSRRSHTDTKLYTAS